MPTTAPCWAKSFKKLTEKRQRNERKKRRLVVDFSFYIFLREGARAREGDYTVKRIAAIHRSRVNKMAHAVGQVVAERLKHRWMSALEKMLDEGAGYDDIVRYLDARGGAGVPFVTPEPVGKPFSVEDLVPWQWSKEADETQ